METLRRKVTVVVLAQSQHFCLSEAARSSRGQGGHATSPVASVSGEAIFPGEAQCSPTFPSLMLGHTWHLAPSAPFTPLGSGASLQGNDWRKQSRSRPLPQPRPTLDASPA